MTPQGWYPDPSTEGVLRWWDGQAWTAHVNPIAPASAPSVQQTSAAPPTVVPHAPPPAQHGLFGGRKALEDENAQLRAQLSAMGVTERDQLRDEVARLRTELTSASAQLEAVKGQLVADSDEAMLQEVGVYAFRHPLDSSVAYRGQIAALRERIKYLVRNGLAVVGHTTWEVNGSKAQGSQLTGQTTKLMLRAYNNEADDAVRSMKPYRLDPSLQRLNKARDTISRLGRMMNIAVTDEYHQARCQELELTADFLAKVEDEKEQERERKAQLREEELARREYERERLRLQKEAAHYQSALNQMLNSGNDADAVEARAKLAEIEAAIAGVDARSANTRAGYVYVISNVGSFGERMVKIGMTRRLEPMDRVRELGDASVPFRYDVHALIFHDDAVALENRLHHALADKRVNLVNARREFFYVTPSDVRTLLGDMEGPSLLQFDEFAEAVEWRQSENSRPTSVGVRPA